MNKIRIIILQMALAFLPIVANASAYLLEIKGSGKVNEALTIQVIYGHIDEYSIRHRDAGKELTLAGEFRITVKDDKGKVFTVPISQKADRWEGTFKPTHEGVYRVLGINDSHPVVDRSKTNGKNVRPIDYLCAEYQVGTSKASPTQATQLLDIITTNTAGIITIKAFNNGKPAAANTKLRVFNPENWEKELTLDDKGEAVFKTTMPGLYIIRQDWDDKAAGSYKNVAYVSVRHRCNYSLLIQ